MRKIALLALPFVLLTTGCSFLDSKTHSGCGFWWYTPPSIDTNMPVLVNAPVTGGTAHPLGSVAGPVSEGQFTHAPTVPIPPQVMPRGTSSIGTCDPCSPQCGPPRLTVQEFREMTQAINSAPTPAAAPRNQQ